MTPSRITLIKIAYKLSVDGLFLFLFASIGYVVAEAALPGMFSARISFFSVYLLLLALLILLVVFHKMIEGEQHTLPSLRSYPPSVRWIILGSVLILLIPSMRSLGAWFGAILLGVTGIFLFLILRSLLETPE